MLDVTLADAKEQLSELIERVERGESVQIVRDGKPVAQIVGMEKQRKPIDLASLRALRKTMPLQEESAGDFVRRLRDEERY